MDELDAPMVYLAADQHAFLVLGDGDEAVITWSKSYRLAKDQADVHGGLVVAVPVVYDASWRARRQGPTQVAVPASSLPRPVDLAERVQAAGYPVGRGGQGRPDGYSSKRDGVVGQDHTPATDDSRAVVGRAAIPVPLLARRRPERFLGVEALPVGPPTPEQYEETLRVAFAGVTHPREAVAAFHTPAKDGVAVCAAVLAGLIHLDDGPTRRPDGGTGRKIPTGL